MCLCTCCGCGICTVISLTLLVCLSLLPSHPDFPVQLLIPDDVILYALPDSKWLENINLELLSYGSCSAEAISVKCSDIQFTEAINSTYIDPFDYHYFAQGTEVLFSLNKSRTINCEFFTPYYVWLFTSKEEADRNSEAKFGDLKCSDPPSDTWCIKIENDSPSSNFTISKSSYYFIRCGNDKCTLLANIVIDLKKYDFESTRNAQIDSVQLQTEQRSNDLNLHKSFLSGDEVCILAVVDDSSKLDYKMAHIIVKDYHRRSELLIFPGLFFSICLLGLLIIVIVFLVYMCCINENAANYRSAYQKIV